jgi:hypothetical protein
LALYEIVRRLLRLIWQILLVIEWLVEKWWLLHKVICILVGER